MSGQPNPYNYDYYGGYNPNLNQPRSLMENNWTYPPVAPVGPYGPPQYPAPPQIQHPRPALVQPEQLRPLSNPRATRPFRPRGASQSVVAAKTWPGNNKEWMDKLEKDMGSTTLDFKQATEEGGARFSDRIHNRLENAKLVGGDLIMEICKAATTSETEGTIVGLDKDISESAGPSLMDQILAIEKLEEQMKKRQNDRANLSDTSSEDSDDTVIQTELLKQFNISGGSSDSDNNTNNSKVVQPSKSVDNPKSNRSTNRSSVASKAESEESLPHQSSTPVVEHESSDTSIQASSQATKSSSEIGTSSPEIPVENDPVTIPVPVPRVLSRKINRLLEKRVNAKIRHTSKVRNAVSRELKRRKELLETSLSTMADVEGPTSSTSSSNASCKVLAVKDNTQASSNTSFFEKGRIPKLSLDPLVVKASIDRVAKRRRLATFYKLISEILQVKQILARGNPFQIIPQHAYDISKVPGIMLPHIQLLLKQWQYYFSNLLYQVVQMEYSLEFLDVEKRILMMEEGGEKFGMVYEFQSFIGKEEVAVVKHGHPTNNRKIEQFPSNNKKMKLEEWNQSTEPSSSSVKKERKSAQKVKKSKENDKE